jgi:hypothetical protein
MASFWRYFWTAQLVMGIAMAARAFPEGLSDGGIGEALLFAVGGFAVTTPIAALIAAGRLVYDRRRSRQLVP